jgi:DNA (cytosine-5)-methyltransferase 1
MGVTPSRFASLFASFVNLPVEIINPLKGKSPFGWHFEQNVYSEDSNCRSLKSAEGSGNKPKIIIDRSKCKCNEGEVCEVCCVDCGNYKDECNCETEMKIRRLTPIECERLQGFPDNWTEGFSDTQRYKMMGNAVTVNVIAAIGEKLSQSNEETKK